MPKAPKWLNDALEKIAPSMIRMVKVIDTVYINKNIKKIRLKGDFSSLNFTPGFTISLRVTPTELRHYTVCHTDTSGRFLEFMAYLHGNAVGTDYIENLSPDEKKIKLAVLGSDRQYNPNVNKQIIFGDETSLSLMQSFLPFLKDNNHQYRFYIELDAENREIPEKIGLQNYIVFVKNDIFRDEEKIQGLPLFNDEEWIDANVILTGNVQSIQNFRKVLKRNHHRGKIYAKGYWLEGKKGL